MTPLLDILSRSHFGPTWPEAGQRANAETRRHEGAGTAFGENGKEMETAENGGLHEREITTNRAQAGRLPAPYDGDAEETGQHAYTEYLL